MGGAGVGVGSIFGNYLAAALRNPSAAQGQFGNLIFGFAVTEALGIFLAADRAAAAVRALSATPQVSGHQVSRHRDGDRNSAHRHTGRQDTVPAVQQGDLRLPAVWLVIFFVALYVIIARMAIPRLGGIIEARSQRIDGDMAEAKRLKDQSDAALAAYEKSLADARARAQALANETRDRLSAEADATRKKLEDRAERPPGQGRRDHRRDQDHRDDQCAGHRHRRPHRPLSSG